MARAGAQASMDGVSVSEFRRELDRICTINLPFEVSTSCVTMLSCNRDGFQSYVSGRTAYSPSDICSRSENKLVVLVVIGCIVVIIIIVAVTSRWHCANDAQPTSTVVVQQQHPPPMQAQVYMQQQHPPPMQAQVYLQQPANVNVIVPVQMQQQQQQQQQQQPVVTVKGCAP